MNKISRKRAGIAGFTLIELMITVAIIAILAAIAISSYNWAMVKSRRAATVSCLQQSAQLLERFYTTNMTYLGATVPTSCEGVSSNFYKFDYLVTPTATAFTLRAAPTSKQNDTLCGTLTLNQQGVRTASGTASASPAQCW